MATIPSQPLAQAPMSLGPTNSPTSRSLSATFSDPAPYQFTQYYRNGPLVPDNAANSGIPTSGPIALSQFVGATSDPAAQSLSYTISADTQNLDLLAYASSPSRPAPTRYVLGGAATVTYTISPGIYVGSATTSQNAIVTGANDPTTGWQPTVTLTVINQGIVLGAGGAGAPGYYGSTAGSFAGTAIVAQRAITIQNAGTFAGGGGGGGTSGGVDGNYGDQEVPVPVVNGFAAGGGGGAGTNTPPNTGGAGGIGGQPIFIPGPTVLNGVAGTRPAGGLGGEYTPTIKAGTGGGRGAAGQSGQASPGYPGGAGGAAGYYAKGNANITWQAVGTRQGQVQPTV